MRDARFSNREGDDKKPKIIVQPSNKHNSKFSSSLRRLLRCGLLYYIRHIHTYMYIHTHTHARTHTHVGRWVQRAARVLLLLQQIQLLLTHSSLTARPQSQTVEKKEGRNYYAAARTALSSFSGRVRLGQERRVGEREGTLGNACTGRASASDCTYESGDNFKFCSVYELFVFPTEVISTSYSYGSAASLLL